jgi:WD40 repeat protein
LVFEFNPGSWQGNDIAPAWPISFCGDGSRIAFPNYRCNHATIVNVRTRTIERTLAGHRQMVRDIAFSVDGVHVATGSDDRTAKVWDATSGRVVHTLNMHTMPVRAVAFSPANNRVATGSSDQSLRFWDLATGAALHKATGHKGEICDLSYSPDGQFVASAGGDRDVRIWPAL